MMRSTGKSIVQSDCSRCFLCGRNGATDRLEKHHIFGGANRRLSEEDGLYVYLCGDRCHRNGKIAVHKNRVIMDTLHEIGQKAYETHIGSREKFMERYGKNYLEYEKDFSQYMNRPGGEKNEQSNIDRTAYTGSGC